MKCIPYFLFLILPALFSCQNEEEELTFENQQSELVVFLKNELGDIEGKSVYLFPSSLGENEAIVQLLKWVDGRSEKNSKILIVGKLGDDGLMELVQVLDTQYGEIYHTNKGTDLIVTAEKLEIKGSKIINRQEFDKILSQ